MEPKIVKEAEPEKEKDQQLNPQHILMLIEWAKMAQLVYDQGEMRAQVIKQVSDAVQKSKPAQ